MLNLILFLWNLSLHKVQVDREHKISSNDFNGNLFSGVPTGTIMMYSGTAASLVGSNSDWLFCDGSAVSRTTYRELFKVIGTRYGAGDGVNTFNLPDFRARFLMGSNTSSTTLASGGAASTTLTTGQLPSHSHTQGTLVTASSGSHTHSASDSGHTHSFTTGTSGPSNNIVTVNSGSYTNVAQSGTHTHSGTTNNGYASISVASDGSHTHTISGSTDSVGSGQSIDILPPYHTVHYVIRT